MGAPVVIGRGFDARIELDPSSMIVRKRFGDANPAAAAAHVRRESSYLGRFASALAPLPYLACPEPIGVADDGRTLLMTYRPGVPLDDLLAGCSHEATDHLDHVAGQIALALERYVDTFAEPYYDFSTMNMLYDPPTRTLSLVDFCKPIPLPGVDADTPHLEVGLGFFLGLGIYRTVRPSTVARSWRCRRRLAVAVLAGLAASHDLDPGVIRRVAAHCYERMSRFGARARRLWYAGGGRMVYRQRSEGVLGEIFHERLPAPRDDARRTP